jgi:glucosamine--fructose-6-phosphate aminotransferase (isomerizing)
MCGIVGAVSTRNIVPILVQGLQRLEYRGYDSCGVAVHTSLDGSPVSACAGPAAPRGWPS